MSKKNKLVKGKIRRINICGAWYACILKGFEEEYKDCYGLHSYNDRTIEINTDVPEYREESVIAHEVCHAILDQCEIDTLLEKYVDEKTRVEIEEAICRAMERGYKAFKNI